MNEFNQDKKCALWSIVLATQNICKEKYHVEFSTQHLQRELKKVCFRKVGNDEEFHPLHFDDVPEPCRFCVRICT